MNESNPDRSPLPNHGEPRPAERSLVVASNRLPISLRIEGDQWTSARSSGGLAAALEGLAKEDPFTWVGWPGCQVPDELQPDVVAAMGQDRLVPVFLDEDEEQHYYHGISNQVLWPLFHYFADKVDFRETSWDHYAKVNRRFADRILEIAPPGARVWVHDFHLMLVPGILRQQRPDLEIGFFLHIPFPSSEIYRLLPAREELLEGLLGADYIGFHTHDYARHFRASCLRVLGLESEYDAVFYDGRRIGIGGHPIGIDVKGFLESMASAEAMRLLGELRERYRGRRIVLGVERLDYTKGVGLKLQAFERLLQRRPDLAQQVVLVQVLVPSRLDNPDYARLKREIDEYVGRINGRFGRPGSTPIEYLHRNLPREQLVALYRLADVALVTPIRDGMNLVAQEFVLCQSDHESLPDAFRGMLVLSEFAGAAQVLPHALLVNPWDIDSTVDVLEEALDMAPTEKAERMGQMSLQVRALECGHWARQFLARLTRAADRQRATRVQSQVLDRDTAALVREQCFEADRRVLFLDYDGTLRELMRTPEEAAPTPEIRELLAGLAEMPNTSVHIVSGRHRDNLDLWFGDLGVHLSAEHGFAWRDPGQSWREQGSVDLSWLPVVQEILLDVSEEVPGTRLERKPCALAWHYRMADPDYGTWRARELHSQLEQDLAHLPVDILHGHRVIEIRAAGIHKGGYLRQVLVHEPEGAFVMCIGDDRTDRDMYDALPENAVSIHVGRPNDETRYTIESPQRVRAFLASLVQTSADTQQAR